MTCPQLRAALAAVIAFGFAACARPPSQPRVVGPVIGESTAQGPSDYTVPPPDPGGVKEGGARIRGTPSQVANPVITVDTMPSTLEPSGNSDMTGSSANQQPATVVAPTVTGTPTTTSGTTTTGTANGTQAAGPNGPGTGNTVTPATPAAPTTPATPAPTGPSNGPGTGNTVNRAAPTTPAPTVTPR